MFYACLAKINARKFFLKFNSRKYILTKNFQNLWFAKIQFFYLAKTNHPKNFFDHIYSRITQWITYCVIKSSPFRLIKSVLVPTAFWNNRKGASPTPKTSNKNYPTVDPISFPMHLPCFPQTCYNKHIMKCLNITKIRDENEISYIY